MSTTQPLSAGRAPSVISTPAAESVSTRQPISTGVASGPVISTAGAELSFPSITSPRTVAPAVTVSATPFGGSIRTLPVPSAGTRVTGLSTSRFSR